MATAPKPKLLTRFSTASRVVRVSSSVSFIVSDISDNLKSETPGIFSTAPRTFATQLAQSMPEIFQLRGCSLLSLVAGMGKLLRPENHKPPIYDL